MTKKAAQRVHATRRAYERYGLDLHRRDIDALVRMIQRGNGVCIGKSSNRVTLWELEYAGNRLPVVYDRKRKTIVTVLPDTKPEFGCVLHEEAIPVDELADATRTLFLHAA